MAPRTSTIAAKLGSQRLYISTLFWPNQQLTKQSCQATKQKVAPFPCCTTVHSHLPWARASPVARSGARQAQQRKVFAPFSPLLRPHPGQAGQSFARWVNGGIAGRAPRASHRRRPSPGGSLRVAQPPALAQWLCRAAGIEYSAALLQ